MVGGVPAAALDATQLLNLELNLLHLRLDAILSSAHLRDGVFFSYVRHFRLLGQTTHGSGRAYSGFARCGNFVRFIA